ncbi:Hypothetical protein ORPV_753 [Orpheovirus IHUMI-LCC2]|uniref:MORN-repeat protein n=1 Tax=Orpheovirus IHUMI-LCC2 TaxID=2023057 RepID=A0A2I2L555_9VIRU|nr:Hypothetical protein ORPV_753 [Orpheovirus IHUMI-LCC2]SNW62657.1 Hypothetical protein ORPV_753 [Orpheovirus IHUMI-LCC2]
MSLLDLPDDILIYNILYEDLEMYMALYRLCKKMNILANKLGKDHYVNEENIYTSGYMLTRIENKKTKIMCKEVTSHISIFLEDKIFGTIYDMNDNNIDSSKNNQIMLLEKDEVWCKYYEGITYHYKTYYNKNGNIRKEIRLKHGYINIGRHIQYDDEGNVLEEINYNNNGELHGICILLRSRWDGVNVRIQMEYVNGKLNGIYKIYDYDSNVLIYEGNEYIQLLIII